MQAESPRKAFQSSLHEIPSKKNMSELKEINQDIARHSQPGCEAESLHAKCQWHDSSNEGNHLQSLEDVHLPSAGLKGYREEDISKDGPFFNSEWEAREEKSYGPMEIDGPFETSGGKSSGLLPSSMSTPSVIEWDNLASAIKGRIDSPEVTGKSPVSKSILI